MEKKEKFWMGAALLFLGIIAGFMLAPIKKGIYCGNNNGNNGANRSLDDGDSDEAAADDSEDLPF